MTIELRDIPETAHLWIQRRKHAYRGLTLGAATAGQRQANATALNGYLSNAAGGVLELPAGATIEVAGTLTVPASMRIQGNGATLRSRDAIGGRDLIRMAQGIEVDIEGLTLSGYTIDEIAAAGAIAVNGIQAGASSRLNLYGIKYTNYFSQCVQGSVGAIVDIDRCNFQAWSNHCAGGDGAKAWIVRNSYFGEIAAGGNSHHLYINPAVWLYIENCEFSGGADGYSVHYYGTSSAAPYRTPVFRSCVFNRKLFTCENEVTIIEDCDINAQLQVQNDTVMRGGRIGDGVSPTSFLAHRTSRMEYVLFDSVVINTTPGFEGLNCEANNPNGTYYRFENCNGLFAGIGNKVNPINRTDWIGGHWRVGGIGHVGIMHIGGRAHISNDVSVTIWEGGSYTEGEVVRYD